MLNFDQMCKAINF